MLSQFLSFAKLDGYKTYIASAAVALAALAGILSDQHTIIEGVEIIFASVTALGVGHKLDKAKKALEL